ncbi:DUF2203 domain-containing protein [Candidatus Woesearchaeota archaeon]|nr:DUF2203 domain-containing protein [Candidatus Woesearchaeota archaeon]
MKQENQELSQTPVLHLPERKYFTLQEAEALLPQIEEHLLEVLKIRDARRLLQTIDIQFPDPFVAHAKEVRAHKEMHRLYFLEYQHLDALAILGCFVKDAEKGLVDFYSKKEGKDVFLCWKFGESCVEHWHDIVRGFETRRKIDKTDVFCK